MDTPNQQSDECTAEVLKPTAGFLEACAGTGIGFGEGEVERLGAYLGFLLHANRSFNLTAITDPAEAWMKHVFDALTLIPLLSELSEAKGLAFEAAREAGRIDDRDPTAGRALRVIDVGSGGGVPGIPLAITLPETKFLLLEPTGKKAAFLTEVVERLNLKNVRVIQERAERLGQARDHRETYDIAMARAVGALNVLAELTVPFVRMHGLVLAVKGARADEEIAHAAEALRQVGGVYDSTITTPTGRVVVIRKGMKTPRTYPRGDGMPKNRPIGGKQPVAVAGPEVPEAEPE
ncbi:MAG: 16S rRNA (guanine(527)-N(7))-methyltransferase RsmG [Phycisphaerales bacterium]